MPNRYAPVIPATYPITIVYGSGIIITAAYLGEVLALNISLLIFTLVYVLCSFSVVRRELRRVQYNNIRLAAELDRVHTLVNSKSDAQLERIAELEILLIKAGEKVPPNQEGAA